MRPTILRVMRLMRSVMQCVVIDVGFSFCVVFLVCDICRLVSVCARARVLLRARHPILARVRLRLCLTLCLHLRISCRLCVGLSASSFSFAVYLGLTATLALKTKWMMT